MAHTSPWEELNMFKTDNYRAMAARNGERAKNTNVPGEMHEFQKMERSFTSLANNEEWLADNFDKTLHAPAGEPLDQVTLADTEEHMLRCLGAAVIMQWGTIPTKLQRELFDNAGSMGDLLRTAELRGQLARFLHNHNDEQPAA
jgi:hypothetical protein